jgi:hypothetical protein
MPQEKPEKVVTISMKGGLPVPDQDPIVVKQANQKVRWCAEFDFTIDVAGYDDLKYSTGGNPQYKCTTGTFPDIKQYKYSITANGVTNDPTLDIRP